MRPLGWHVVAHATGDRLPLDTPDRARWLWRRLREHWPQALGCTLMPNHLHLVTPRQPDLELLRHQLAGQARTAGSGRTWQVPTPAEPLGSTDKLARVLRYVALNPCRPFRHAGREWVLVKDPLAWTWSTHRGIAGAAAHPWITTQRLATALGRPPQGLPARWHRYVSSDAWVAPGGTPLPTVVRPRATARLDLEELAMATLAATRGAPLELQRRGPSRTLFLTVASLGGWRDQETLAARADCSSRTVRRASAPASHVAAVLSCLGDPRLLHPQPRTLDARRMSGFRTSKPAGVAQRA